MRDWLEYYRIEVAEADPLPLDAEADKRDLLRMLDLAAAILPVSVSRQDRDQLVASELACQRLCVAYVDASANARTHLRRRLEPKTAWALVPFGRKCATLAVRTKNPAVINCGLVAQTVGGLRHNDIRDVLLVLSALWSACDSAQLDAREAFLSAAALTSKSMNLLLTDFADSKSSTATVRRQ